MIYHQGRRAIAGWFWALVIMGVAPGSHAQTYLVTDLGVPPVFSYNGVYGSQINADGDVAGYLLSAGQPLVVSDGNRMALSALHLETSADANAINASGVVVGSSCEGDFEQCHGVEWTNGVPSELASGVNFTPKAINAAGEIAGVVIGYADISAVASVFRNGALIALPHGSFQPGGGEALAINDSGVIAGTASDPTQPDGTTIGHAVLWSGSTIQDLRADAGATGINDLGQVVGYARAPDGYDFHAATWSDGKFTDLGAPNDYSSVAAAINATGVIVGQGSKSALDRFHALVWTGGSMSDLNDLIDSKLASQILLTQAVSINDSGQILVNGYDTTTGVSHAYVLSPSGAAKVAQPTFSVIPRSYASTQIVTLADTTPGATIHYTLDGTLPTSGSATYTNALTIDSTTTIRATAYLNSYQPSPAASGTFEIISGAGSVALNLSAANILAIGDQGPAVKYGLDGLGDVYASDLLGKSLLWSGVQFTFNQATAFNAAANTTLALPAGKFTSIKLLATGARGNRPHETFTVTYTDGTTAPFNQGISDWYTPQAYPGESTALTMSYRVTKTGVVAYGPYHLYGYTFTLDQSKTAKSLTLPDSKYVVVLAATMSGEKSSTQPSGRFPLPKPGPIRIQEE